MSKHVFTVPYIPRLVPDMSLHVPDFLWALTDIDKHVQDKLPPPPVVARLRGAADKTMHFGLPHTWDHPMDIVRRNDTNQGHEKCTFDLHVFNSYPTDIVHFVHASGVSIEEKIAFRTELTLILFSRSCQILGSYY